ncbi:DUF3823 domain-containing protein, partial [Ornithinibacillus gellani]|uniref:carboxypeptidase regulatory-like domain-containing protein n=1 Tax=Ornithinibacillus gellani TaxID=2293253 RepID=UPI000F4903AD
VTLHYEQDGETVEVTANRISGDYKSGEYKATIPGDAIAEGSLTYYWTLNDFGNNEVQTDDYTVDVKPGITVGYFEDFESTITGWYSFGDNDTWEHGAPTTGPEEAYSGDKVYATNLSGNYASSMDAILVMPPVELPEGQSFLQFKNWYNFEESSTGRAWDYGHVVISSDGQEWTELTMFQGLSEGWENTEIDLSEYAGQTVLLGYKAFSDGSVTRDGWYIDDVALSDVSQYDNDEEPPTFEHVSPLETYTEMDVFLSVDVADNLKLNTVELSYENADGEWQTLDATQESGSERAGTFTAVIPWEDIDGKEELPYKWIISDYGSNITESDVYTIEVKPGVTVGYEEDFENAAAGWYSFGDNDSWEWGSPESGPENAASGDHVFATNLTGTYDTNMRATLVMPAIDLPEGSHALQFDSWHEFEESTSGTAWDYGQIVISTDLEEWTELQKFQGLTEDWETVTIDLSDYSGRVYIGFYAYSDGSIVKDGWYIDNVSLIDTSEDDQGANISLGISNEKQKEIDIPVLQKESTPQTWTLDRSNEKNTADKDIGLAQLPMAAKVSVLESGRSVNTNPQDGSYALMHATGTFTLKAEAYGFESAEQSVEVEADETSTANFTLQEIPQGTIQGTVTDEATGEPVEDATLLLVEDANVTPVQTDADGNYQLTAYEGTYTLKISARGYHGQEAEVTVDGDVTVDFALEPFYMVPGGEIGYDDG